MAKKFTYEYVYNYFKTQSCELLSDSYTNSKTKMSYICSCGNISITTLGDFKSGCRCKKCAGNEKHTYEYVHNYFKSQGCELLSKKYVNAMTKMSYICSCGNHSEIKFNTFKNGTRCKRCGNKKSSDMQRYSYEYVHNYFEEQNCTLLDESYIDSKTKMKYICSCGEKSEIIFNSFKNGHRCKSCGYKNRSMPTKHSFEYIKAYFEEQNCKLLSKEYFDKDSLLEYICSCGIASKISFNNFRNGHRCISCGAKKTGEKLRHTYSEVYDYFKDNGCVLLSLEYIDNISPLNYICECGRESKITFSNFKNGNSCKRCGYAKITGKNNYNWNPNKTDEERIRDSIIKRNYPEYKQWRTDVFERDNYNCQCCGVIGGTLNAHHLEGMQTTQK